jgi:exodeoxyribonuclease VII large subunit
MSLFDDLERRPLSVSELTAQVRGALEGRFASVWVEGEISNFVESRAGHWYFTLKDEGAQLRAACFRNVNARIRFTPGDGLLVRLRGRLTVFDPKGEYQLAADSIEPVGAGALRVAFEQLKEKLAREGLFDEELKRPLPLLPRRVAVVTSPTGAALRDILNVLARRTRTVDVVLSPTLVQGAGAGREIAAALGLVNELHAGGTPVDVIIVGRGGGSAEDLWAFNEEIVARAIRASKIPVISAVGHETDYTIADFAADLRAPTPSAAAELVAAQEESLAFHLDNLTNSLAQTVRYRLLEARSSLQETAMSPAFDDVRRRLRVAQQATDEAAHRLETAGRRAVQLAGRRAEAVTAQLTAARVQNRLAAARLRCQELQSVVNEAMKFRVAEARARLATAVAALDAMSPLAVLQRGYAVALDEQNRLLTDARSVPLRAPVRVRLARGTLHCKVEKTETF